MTVRWVMFWVSTTANLRNGDVSSRPISGRSSRGREIRRELDPFPLQY